MARTYARHGSSDSSDDDTYTKKKQQQGRRRPSPAGGDQLLEGVGRLSISATTNPRWSRQGSSPGYDYNSDGGRRQRSPQLFQQWMSGDADSRTVLSKLGYGARDEVGDDRVQRQPSLLPHKQPSLTAGGKYNGDAPLVDLHIHIDHNNIGSLAFGMDGKN